VQADTAVAAAQIAITDPLWTGLGGNLLWSNPSNWSDDAVPGAGGLVVLGNGDGAVTSPYTATFDPSLANIGTLAIDGSGSFDPVMSSLTIGADHTLDAANVLLGGFGALAIGGVLNVSGALGTGAESVTAGAVATSPANAPSVNLESNGLLTIGGGDADFIAFNGVGEVLTFTSSNSTVLTTEITGGTFGFAKGDVIDFSGLTWQSGLSIRVDVHGDATIFNTAAPSVALANFTVLETFSSLSVKQDNGTGTEVIACFAAGTRIATPDGPVAVEALRVGDHVMTVAGGAGSVARPVRWIGRRGIDLERHADRARAEPIRIRKDAIAQGQPSRDLLVSPDHAVFLDDALIPARLLVNGGSITRETAARQVVYYHVELDSHDVLYAEGLPVESYLDTGGRAMFENGGGAMRPHPDFGETAAAWETRARAPLLTAPNAVRPVWRRLAERATRAGWRPPARAATPDVPDRRSLAG
jgi:hypothetical protein